MNERNPCFVVEVRMRIDICFVAMGRPPCVADAQIVVVFDCSFHSHPFDAVAAKAIQTCELCRCKARLASVVVID